MLTKSRKEELCLHCFECCKILYIPVMPVSGDILSSPSIKSGNKLFLSIEESRINYLVTVVHYYETRGFEVLIEGGFLYLKIYEDCPQLTTEGCKIYKQRPQVCRDFDGSENFFFNPVCLWAKE